MDILSKVAPIVDLAMGLLLALLSSSPAAVSAAALLSLGRRTGRFLALALAAFGRALRRRWRRYRTSLRWRSVGPL